MPRYIGTIEVEFNFDGNAEDASEFVTNMCEHLIETFNDDGSLLQCGQSQEVRRA